MGGYVTAGIGIAIFPWKLLESAGGYLFVWLVGYSALLGPIAGVLLADYFLLRRCQLNVDALFMHNSQYGNNSGWNPAGIIALLLGIVPSLPGFLHAAGMIDEVPAIFDTLYGYAWFVGVFTAAAIYLLLANKKSLA